VRSNALDRSNRKKPLLNSSNVDTFINYRIVKLYKIINIFSFWNSQKDPSSIFARELMQNPAWSHVRSISYIQQ